MVEPRNVDQGLQVVASVEQAVEFVTQELSGGIEKAQKVLELGADDATKRLEEFVDRLFNKPVPGTPGTTAADPSATELGNRRDRDSRSYDEELDSWRRDMQREHGGTLGSIDKVLDENVSTLEEALKEFWEKMREELAAKREQAALQVANPEQDNRENVLKNMAEMFARLAVLRSYMGRSLSPGEAQEIRVLSGDLVSIGGEGLADIDTTIEGLLQAVFIDAQRTATSALRGSAGSAEVQEFLTEMSRVAEELLLSDKSPADMSVEEQEFLRNAVAYAQELDIDLARARRDYLAREKEGQLV